MRADKILRLLDGVRSRSHDRWLARCPAHEDHSPSLSIRATHDRVLIRCWAGCSVSDICSASGITVADLFNHSDRHYNPDPERERWRRAAENLERWRWAEVRRIGDELQLRDQMIIVMDQAVHNRVLTEQEAMLSLKHEYADYSDLEHQFDQLIRGENVYELWHRGIR